MVKLVRLQHLGVKSSVGRSLSRSAVRWEFVRIGDEGGGPSGHQMDRIHGGNISPARQFMRLRSGSVGSDTVRLGLPKKGTPADYLKVLDWYPSVPPIVGSVHASRGPHAQSQVAPLHTVHRGG